VTLGLTIRRTLPLSVLLALGCAADPPPPSRLHFTAVGFAEERVPMVFGLRLENRGASPVELDNVRVAVAENLLMTTATRLPVESIASEIHLLREEPAPDGAYEPLQEGKSITVQPGKTAELKCAYQWHLDGDEPPMAAILRGTFAVKHGDEQLARSEPLLFVVQSREGALEAILDGPEIVLKNAAPGLHMLSVGEVEKSPGAIKLIEEFQKAGLIPRD